MGEEEKILKTWMVSEREKGERGGGERRGWASRVLDTEDGVGRGRPETNTKEGPRTVGRAQTI
jgi:hypothetical protein